MDEDWTRQDALRVLALPLHRIRWRDQFVREGQRSDCRRDIYSNGTESDIAIEEADDTLEHGPVLRVVIEAGVRALANDDRFQSYLGALYSGDRDRMVRLEDEVRAALPSDPPPPPGAMTWEQVGDAMVADLHERYPEPSR